MYILKIIILGLIIAEVVYEIYAGHIIGVILVFIPVFIYLFYQKIYSEMGDIEGNEIDLDKDKIDGETIKTKTLEKWQISPYLKLGLLVVSIIVYAVAVIFYMDSKFDLLL